MKIQIFMITLFVIGLPFAFADHSEVTIETADNDLLTPTGKTTCLATEVGCYTPNTTTVDVGHIVTMTNTDKSGIHTFTSGTVDGFSPSPDGIFDSGMLMKPGDSFEYSADTVGEFPYYCTLHVWMQGVLIVQEDSTVSSNPILPRLTPEIEKKVNSIIDDFDSKTTILFMDDFIEQTKVDVIRTVDENSIDITIDEIIQDTILITSEDNYKTISSNEIIEKGISLDEYKETLSSNQFWHFGKGKPTMLVEQGDTILKISWELDNQENFVSTSILDKNSQLKFDSLMYFIPTEVKIYGSSHKMIVNNIFGTMIESELFANLESNNQCQISKNNEENIPQFYSKVAPLWFVEHAEAVSWTSEQGCNEDSAKIVDCADVKSDVYYQSLFPIESVSIKDISVAFGELKMSSGNSQLDLEVCSMEPVFVDNREQGKVGISTIRDVFVEKIDANTEKNNLTLHLSSNSQKNGKINLVLPRYVIDSVDNNSDKNFVVLFDGVEKDNVVERMYESSSARYIEIAVPKGTEKIEIFGTFVIPEFGTYAMLIFLIVITGVVILGQKTRVRFFQS